MGNNICCFKTTTVEFHNLQKEEDLANININESNSQELKNSNFTQTSSTSKQLFIQMKETESNQSKQILSVSPRNASPIITLQDSVSPKSQNEIENNEINNSQQDQMKDQIVEHQETEQLILRQLHFQRLNQKFVVLQRNLPFQMISEQGSSMEISQVSNNEWKIKRNI